MKGCGRESDEHADSADSSNCQHDYTTNNAIVAPRVSAALWLSCVRIRVRHSIRHEAGRIFCPHLPRSVKACVGISGNNEWTSLCG